MSFTWPHHTTQLCHAPVARALLPSAPISSSSSSSITTLILLTLDAASCRSATKIRDTCSRIVVVGVMLLI